MSTQKQELERLNSRLKNIEDDEYGSAKKLYEHTLMMLKGVMGILTLVIFTFGALIGFNFFNADEKTNFAITKVENKLSEFEERFSLISAQKNFKNAVIQYKTAQEVIQYRWRRSYEQAGKDVIQYEGYAEIYGANNIFGALRQINLRVSDDNIPPIYSPPEKADYINSLGELSVTNIEGFINSNAGYPLRFTRTFRVTNCNSIIDEFNNWIATEGNKFQLDVQVLAENAPEVLNIGILQAQFDKDSLAICPPPKE